MIKHRSFLSAAAAAAGIALTATSCGLSAAAAGIALTATGCAFQPGEPEDLQAQLRHRTFLDVSPKSNVDVSAMARGGRTLAVEPSVIGGQAVVRTTPDGWLLVEDLDLPLADVTVPSTTFGDRPLAFTELSLQLGTQLAIHPVEDPTTGSLLGHGQADLLLRWAMVSESGQVVPLAMRRIERAPFTVAIEGDPDGQLHASITARVDRVIDELGELVVLRDLALDVVSASPE